MERKETIKVSIVVPVYNVEKYLEQCVDSLLAQTIDSKEIILVDDGSTDSSGKLCDAYAEKNACVRVIHKQNGGLGSARNAGVKHVTGEYLYFIDSDDWLETDALETLYAAAKRDDLDIVLFGARAVFDQPAGETRQADISYERHADLNIVRTGADSLKRTMAANDYQTSVCLRLYRTAYYRDKGFRFDETVIHEDEDVGFLSYIQASRVEIFSERYYMRRVHSGSIMENRTCVSSTKGYYFAWNQVRSYAAGADLRMKDLCYRQCALYTCLCLENYREAGPEERKQLRAICKEMCAVQKKLYSSNAIRLADFSLGLYCALSAVKETLGCG